MIRPRSMRLVKKRRKIYDREGRSRRWKTLKKKSDKLFKKRARQYMENQKKMLTAHDASRSFFKNIKAYSSKEKPASYNVRDLYPDRDDDEVAEALAEHFIKISREFNGLQAAPLPAADDASLPPLTCAEVVGRLKSFRKPKSMVKGDIFPTLVNKVAASLANPLCNIYNTITATGEWPATWKTEYVTPIPKKPLPESPDDLRNISCTLLLSKVYESFMLDWLTQQVQIRRNQFGGMKGSGAEHFLVDLWQQVLENIEDPRASSLLTSIDYSKAFNRLDFNHCLESLAMKGASNKLLNIIGSFLSGRQM